MTPSTPNVFVCDTQPVMLAGIERVLLEAGLKVVGSTCDVSTCIAEPDALGPLIYVVDQTPGETYSAALIKALMETDPSRRIVVFSAYDHLAMIASAYEAGACAFVNKLSSVRQFLDTVMAVHRLASPRDRYYPVPLATALADFYTTGGRVVNSPRQLLTSREVDVFRMIAEGLTQQQVAEALQLHRRSVGNLLVKIRRKLDIPREHFRSYAIEHGLIDPLRSQPGESRQGPADTDVESAASPRG